MMNTMHTTTTPPQHIDDHLEPHQAVQLPVGITENTPTYRDLEGKPPTTFNGNRSKADRFITQFRLFCIINNGNPIITSPVRRIALALTYIRGPKVEAWVSQQCDALSRKANHARTQADMDETLWEDFMAEFKRAFAETSWELRSRLEALQMAGDDVEMYIATFENLMRREGCKREPVFMVQYFRQGLPTDLAQSILKRGIPRPNTIDEWKSAARKEIESSFAIRYTLGRRNKEDADADVDAGQAGVIRLSEEEKAKYMADGRCFACHWKGHRARGCPNRY
jgi:hypothetical protein